jgi:GNAT superfamily N-acetyltransferase
VDHNGIIFHKIEPADSSSIGLVAKWYYDEWAIPIETTRQRLADQIQGEVVFQLVLAKDNVPVATGGLYHRVGLHEAHPRFKEFGPWVALLYTDKKLRHHGYGGMLLEKIQDQSRNMGIKRIYLYTYTAEGLYLKRDWQPLEKVRYKGHETTVMEKNLKQEGS